MNEYELDLPTVLRQHGPMLKRVARALVSDEHAAADLVQDTWATALQSPPRFTLRRALLGDREGAGAAGSGQAARMGAWLLTTMRNHARSAHRRSSVRTHDAERTTRETSQADLEAASTSETAERLEAQRLVHDALVELEEPLRTTLMLRFHDGLSSTAIAERLGIPASTARSRVQKGLQLLRERLDRRFGGDDGARAAWGAALLPLTRLGEVGAVEAASAGGATVLVGKIVAATALVGGAALGTTALLTTPELEPIEAIAPAGAETMGLPVAQVGAATSARVAASPMETQPPTASLAATAASGATGDPGATGPYVLVVNREGQPQAGFPVALTKRDDPRRQDGEDQEGLCTDSNGRFWLLGEDARLPDARFAFANAPLVPIVVAALPESDELRDAVGEVGRLVVPDTGSVTVKLSQADGSGWAGPARLRLGGTRTRGGDLPEPFYVRFEGSGHTFAHVGIAHSYDVHVDSLGEWCSMSAAYLALKQGERRVHELVVDQPRVVLVGRAVDVRGRPLADIHVMSEIMGESAAGGRSGADGEVRIPVIGQPAEIGGMQVAIKGAFPGRVWSLDGEQRLPMKVKGGDLSVGDIVLTDADYTVAGSFRTLDGKPAGGHCWIPLIQEVAPGRWEPAGITFMPGLDGKFFCLDDVADTTRALAIDLSTPLFANGQRYLLEEPVRFERGARNVEIILSSPAVRVRGSVVVPEGIRRRDVRVRLKRAGCPDQVLEGASFNDWTRIGNVDVEVGLHNHAEPLVRIEDVEILPDGIMDTRLEGIVLPAPR